MRRMASAEFFFNPQNLKRKSEAKIVTVLHYKTDKLLHLSYHQYIPEFTYWLKNEFTKIVAKSNRYNEFDKLVISNKFQTRMLNIIKRKKLDPNTRSAWNNDDAEYTWKVWAWWRGRIYDFTCCDLELRLIVFFQISSCSVEGVFLRLTIVEDAVGEKMKNDMLKFRMSLQCNGDLYEFLDGIPMVLVI